MAEENKSPRHMHEWLPSHPSSGLDHHLLVRADSQDPQCHVTHRRAEHGGSTLDVQPEATVLVLVVPQISQRLLLVGRAEDLVQGSGHVQGDDQAGEEKHGSAVVPWPMPIVLLEAFIESNAPLEVLGYSGSIRMLGHWSQGGLVCLLGHLLRTLQP